jgi:hypothetical protein
LAAERRRIRRRGTGRAPPGPTYVNPDGRLVVASIEESNVPATQLPAGSQITVDLVFPTSRIGGHLRIPVTDSSGNSTTLDAAISRA